MCIYWSTGMREVRGRENGVCAQKPHSPARDMYDASGKPAARSLRSQVRAHTHSRSHRHPPLTKVEAGPKIVIRSSSCTPPYLYPKTLTSTHLQSRAS